MNPSLIKEIEKYVKDNIKNYHTSRLSSLQSVNLKKLLSRKNPYLYKVKNIGIATDFVKCVLDAHLSSSEETIFGDWLEGLAIFVNQKVYSGKKSSTLGIDLEFDRDGIRYLVSIKSGPNWGNSDQIKKMMLNFEKAIKTIKTSNSKQIVEVVNGCCYGKSGKSLKTGNYYKYCGQKFWEFISGEESLYVDIIKPLGTGAKAQNDAFLENYNSLVNKLSQEFIRDFCKKNGSIDWEKVVKYNSSSDDVG
jgi:hypothetical protein